VVDAIGYGLRPIVPRECVGDRALGPHEANLFDLEMKYADVLPLAEVLAALPRS
jgi:maleamate amidohydrolase